MADLLATPEHAPLSPAVQFFCQSYDGRVYAALATSIVIVFALLVARIPYGLLALFLTVPVNLAVVMGQAPVVVGADGVRYSVLFRRRFVPYNQLTILDSDPQGIRLGTQSHVVTLRSGWGKRDRRLFECVKARCRAFYAPVSFANLDLALLCQASSHAQLMLVRRSRVPLSQAEWTAW